MNRKSCFLIGGRYSPSKLKEQLAEIIEKHITEYGITTFTVGRYGFFDSMVRQVLREEKKRHTNIELYSLEPYAFNQ